MRSKIPKSLLPRREVRAMGRGLNLLVLVLVIGLTFAGCKGNGDNADPCAGGSIKAFTEDWGGEEYVLRVIQGPQEWDEVVDLLQWENSLILHFDMYVDGEWYEGQMIAEPKAARQGDISLLVISTETDEWSWSVSGVIELCADTVTADINDWADEEVWPLPKEAYQGLEFELTRVVPG